MLRAFLGMAQLTGRYACGKHYHYALKLPLQTEVKVKSELYFSHHNTSPTQTIVYTNN